MTGQQEQDRPGRRRGLLGELGAAVRRGSGMPLRDGPPSGRSERLGLAPPGGSQAETLPSRLVHAGTRRQIGAELAGTWHGRPALVFDLELATDYSARGGADPGLVRGRFHVAVVGVRRSLPWHAITRQDIREHLEQFGNGIRAPGTGRLDSIRLLADPTTDPTTDPTAETLPAQVLEWAGRDAITRRIGKHMISVIELAGPWALAGVPVAGMEHSDEHAIALAAKLGRPEIGPWPEQLLGLAADLAAWTELPPAGPGSA